MYYGSRAAIAIPVAGVGSCGPGVPFACGRFHPPLTPTPIVLPALTLTGPSTSCPAGGVGLTDALSIRIVGA